MSKNKTTTGILRYPYEGITDTTDYLQITIKRNATLTPDNQKSFIEDAAYAYSSNPASVSGVSASFLKPQVLAENGIILLPMPSNIQDSNSVSYDNDSMNALAAFGAGSAYKIMNGIDLGDLSGSGAKVFAQIQQDARTLAGAEPGSAFENLKNLALTQLASSAVNVFGANTSLNQLLARGDGTIINPNMELLFNNVTLRTFNFSFKMTPRDENESVQVKSIIRSLKKNMSPRLGTTTGSASLGSTPEKAGTTANLGRLYLHTPNIFELAYKKGNKLHPFLNRFKQCALSDMSVNYTGENVYATYNDGTPISLVLNLTFKELVPIYQEDYDDSAFNISGENVNQNQDGTFTDASLVYGLDSERQGDTPGTQANVEGVGF